MPAADRPADHHEVARLAHEIWEADGRPEGRHLEHWHRAQAILAGTEPATGPGGAPYAEAPEMPGPRNPEPIPPANAEGYVTVPSDSDVTPSALGDAPKPPPAKPRRRRAKPDQ
jgi:Protein of unknown function (DUF2934)